MNILLRLPPLGVNHMYGNRKDGKGKYKKPELTSWEDEVLWRLKNRKKEFREDFTILDIRLYFSDRRRRDIDNLLKPILDVLTRSGVYIDDSVITDLTVKKRFDKEKPRLEIDIY